MVSGLRCYRSNCRNGPLKGFLQAVSVFFMVKFDLVRQDVSFLQIQLVMND